MKTSAWVAVVGVVACGLVGLRSQSVTGTGYEWRHMTVWANSTYQHPVTGKGIVAAVLDQAEYAGWKVETILTRPQAGGPDPYIYEFVFRAPVGVPFPPLPSPSAVTPPPPPPPVTGPTAGGTACPLYPNAPFPGARCYPDGGWRP